jgi:hypothetical protein
MALLRSGDCRNEKTSDPAGGHIQLLVHSASSFPASHAARFFKNRTVDDMS